LESRNIGEKTREGERKNREQTLYWVQIKKTWAGKEKKKKERGSRDERRTQGGGKRAHKKVDE